VKLKKLHQLSIALLLVGGLFLELSNQTTLAALNSSKDTNSLASKTLAKPNLPKPKNVLPKQIENLLRQDLSRRVSILPSRLLLLQATQETWSNGCLGLAKPNEFCTQALVRGWRVVFAARSRQWAYRRDANGNSMRLE
jgi:hypothetical protein